MSGAVHTPGRPAAALDLPTAWMHTMSAEELIDAAIWCQEDAAYLYRAADTYRQSGHFWLATLTQDNAAHSAALARAAIARATGSASHG